MTATLGPLDVLLIRHAESVPFGTLGWASPMVVIAAITMGPPTVFARLTENFTKPMVV